MHTACRRTNGNESGIALLTTIFVVVVTASLIAATVAFATVTHRDTQVKRFDTEAQYLSEGAVETGKKAIQVAIANWGAVPPGGTAQIGTVTVPYSIRPTGFSTVSTDPSGIETVVTGYELDSSSMVNGAKSSAHRVIEARAT